MILFSVRTHPSKSPREFSSDGSSTAASQRPRWDGRAQLTLVRTECDGLGSGAHGAPWRSTGTRTSESGASNGADQPDCSHSPGARVPPTDDAA
jgi:hypothetical protein